MDPERKRELDRQYYQANKERIAERDALHYRANREQELERSRRYYQANRQRIKERQREYRRLHPPQENKQQSRQRSLRYRETNKDRLALSKRRRLYRVDEIRFSAMWTEQDGRCLGCLTPLDEVKVVVDHNHACCLGKRACGACVRGLLCDGCNRTLGAAGDDPTTLRRLADYIEARPLKPKDQMRFNLDV